MFIHSAILSDKQTEKKKNKKRKEKRKVYGMGRAIGVLGVVLLLGMFYNLVTMFVHNNYYHHDQDRRADHTMDPVTAMPVAEKKEANTAGAFHVAVTAAGTPYSRWQCRVMYYWYKKKKKGSQMGGFTRILHSGYSDHLVHEIPTFVVDPLPKGMDQGYVVLNRPWAFVQWLKKAKIEEEYVLMAEPDHIFLKPLPNLVYQGYPCAYPFFYIKPIKYEKILRKFFPKEMGPIANVDPIGNSPVIIQKNVLETIAPTWMNVSLNMKNDAAADKKFGWVLEMYAYAVASALHGVQHILRDDLMLQPPHDGSETDNKYILHYTYRMDYNLEGELLIEEKGDWQFDKRTYMYAPPPRNLSFPPPGVPEGVVTLIKLINEATSNLPNWDTSERVTKP